MTTFDLPKLHGVRQQQVVVRGTLGLSGRYDVQNIGTHEAGHTFGLGDMYEPADSEQTMYGYASTGETKKRTLEWGDRAGAATSTHSHTDHLSTQIRQRTLRGISFNLAVAVSHQEAWALNNLCNDLTMIIHSFAYILRSQCRWPRQRGSGKNAGRNEHSSGPTEIRSQRCILWLRFECDATDDHPVFRLHIRESEQHWRFIHSNWCPVH